MPDERRPADGECRDGNPEDAAGRESPDRDRDAAADQGRRGGSGLVALAIVMLLAVAGLLGLWWWTQREGETIVPAATEEAADEVEDPEDDSSDWLDIPSFRGPSDESEPSDPDGTPPDRPSRSDDPAQGIREPEEEPDLPL